MLSAESLGVALSDGSSRLLEKGLRAKKQVATVDCPKSMVGRVIGKNGETIRALQNYSGALIQIDQTVDPMKVTISGTSESLNLAVSMVTDIVNGTFKGFAMLRQIASQVEAADALCQPVYAPGYGLIPPSQVCNAQFGAGGSPVAAGQQNGSPGVACGGLRSSPVSPLDMGLAWEQQQQQEGASAADVILGLTNTIAQLSVDASSQSSSLSGANPDAFLGGNTLSGGYQGSYCGSFDGSPMGGSNQLGLGGIQSTALKHKLHLTGFEPQAQSNHGMRHVGQHGLAEINPYNSSSRLGVSSPYMDQGTESRAFQNVKQMQSLSPLSSPLQSSCMYSTPNMPVSGGGSPIHNADKNSQNGCIRLRDPSGRSFYLDVMTGQTRWANNVENTDSYFFAQ